MLKWEENEEGNQHQFRIVDFEHKSIENLANVERRTILSEIGRVVSIGS